MLSDLLNRLRDTTGRQRFRLGLAQFNSAVFIGEAYFRHAVFEHDAWFDNARFDGHADFDGADFASIASFRDVVFRGNAGFAGAEFKGATLFGNAEFRRRAAFGEAIFRGTVGDDDPPVDFANVKFGEAADFGLAQFEAAADFRNTRYRAAAVFARAEFQFPAGFADAEFRGHAEFSDATFSDVRFTSARFAGTSQWGCAIFAGTRFTGHVGFDWASFVDTVTFLGAVFPEGATLGPLVCATTVDLSQAVFGAAVSIKVAAQELACVRTRWAGTATLRLRYATVDLTDAEIIQPLAVTVHHAPFPNTEPDEAQHLTGDPSVRIASLRGVDAMNLQLTDTDLTACRFAGAFHLDQIRVEGHIRFSLPPVGVHWRRGLPRHSTRRRVLAEEHAWRAQKHPPAVATAPTAREWRPGRYQLPLDGRNPDPSTVAPVYRALRKAFEDSKNEPGAADFYYGEMGAT